MNTSERAYRLLLHAYPRSFRSEYGVEMTTCFRDQHRVSRGLRFWIGVIIDIARSAPAQRLDVLRKRQHHIQPLEGTMKAISILAILIGALEVVNALTEVRIGAGYSLWGGLLAVAGGLVLLGAGIALLRRSTRAATLAETAAVACAAVFLFVGVVKPMMSIASTILGIGFPIALVIFLRVSRGRGPSAPRTA